MSRWLIKAMLQGAMSRLPRPHFWNSLFQRYVTRTLKLDDRAFESKLAKASRHLANYRQATGRELPASALELGTGWYPVVPVALWLGGVDRVHTCDITRLTSRDRIFEVLHRFDATCTEHLREQLPGFRPDRFAQLGQVLATAAADPLAELGITAILGDIRQLDFRPGDIELALSNNTFEHIPEADLATILAAFRRYLGPGGVCSHHIDLADHYANIEPAIGPYHFLRYSAARWRWFNNSLQYQNRLQVSDHRRLHEQAGWRIVAEETTSGNPADLDRIPLHPDFQRYPREELLVTGCWLVSVPAAPSAQPSREATT